MIMVGLHITQDMLQDFFSIWLKCGSAHKQFCRIYLGHCCRIYIELGNCKKQDNKTSYHQNPAPYWGQVLCGYSHYRGPRKTADCRRHPRPFCPTTQPARKSNNFSESVPANTKHLHNICTMLDQR